VAVEEGAVNIHGDEANGHAPIVAGGGPASHESYWSGFAAHQRGRKGATSVPPPPGFFCKWYIIKVLTGLEVCK
jgi:hypothetical protein